MAAATTQGVYGLAYLQALLAPADAVVLEPTPAPGPIGLPAARLAVADLPPQAEVDRALSTYETYVWIPDCVGDQADALATLSEVLP
jgi:hypothetical protein